MILSNHGNVIRIGITYKEIPLQKFIERNSLQTKSRNEIRLFLLVSTKGEKGDKNEFMTKFVGSIFM